MTRGSKKPVIPPPQIEAKNLVKVLRWKDFPALSLFSSSVACSQISIWEARLELGKKEWDHCGFGKERFHVGVAANGFQVFH